MRFFPAGGEVWIGNLEPGLTVLNEVIETSATGPITVIAEGQGDESTAIDARVCGIRREH